MIIARNIISYIDAKRTVHTTVGFLITIIFIKKTCKTSYNLNKWKTHMLKTATVLLVLLKLLHNSDINHKFALLLTFVYFLRLKIHKIS